LFAGFKRSMIGGRLRAGAEKNIEMIKEKIESEYEKHRLTGSQDEIKQTARR
jgi:hypothetical protein